MKNAFLVVRNDVEGLDVWVIRLMLENEEPFEMMLAWEKKDECMEFAKRLAEKMGGLEIKIEE